MCVLVYVNLPSWQWRDCSYWTHAQEGTLNRQIGNMVTPNLKSMPIYLKPVNIVETEESTRHKKPNMGIRDITSEKSQKVENWQSRGCE